MLEINADVKSYVQKFALYYIGVSVLLAAIGFFIEIPSFISILAYFLIIRLVMTEFIEKHKRPFEEEEKKGFVKGAFAVSMAITLFGIVMISIFAQGTEEAGFILAPIFWIIMAVIAGLLYAGTNFAVGYFPKGIIKQLEKQGKM